AEVAALGHAEGRVGVLEVVVHQRRLNAQPKRVQLEEGHEDRRGKRPAEPLQRHGPDGNLCGCGPKPPWKSCAVRCASLRACSPGAWHTTRASRQSATLRHSANAASTGGGCCKPQATPTWMRSGVAWPRAPFPLTRSASRQRRIGASAQETRSASA